MSATGGRAERAPWQTIDSGQLLLIAIAGLMVLIAITQVSAVGLERPQTAVIFGVLIAIGELLRMVMPGNREVAPIATAGVLGYGMLLSVGAERATHSALQVVAVAAVGMLVGSLPHVAVGRSPRLDAMARRLLSTGLVALLFRPVSDASLRDVWWAVLALMATFVMLSCLVDISLAAMIRAEAVRARFGIAVRDEIGAKLALCAATGATGMLIAVATSVMGLAALIVFTAPILVTQFAFRRYAGIRATYLQTVRALSRVTEVGGYVETGHSRRVSQLSVATGRELGMAEPELLELEYAALMHDIGQLSLGDPIPGGATVLASPADQRRIAELGAEVIKQTGVLDRVAEIVRRQSDSYLAVRVEPVRDERAATGGPAGHGPDGSGRDSAQPLASRVIKVANAYDDLVGDSSDRDRSAAVLERLRLDSISEYDPTVVEALGRVVERRTAIRY
ncbi:HD-GYP domain-containing protein [Actinomadura sp. HBU206391]|uniref:HD-GYP domain-containing protein n=1 Tax=Actinomadura sp. HBU206391 TaxID=2731692 RepID=UPI00164FA3A4|nr:HD domain-containing protein [Actinomadura sp. HBU206391]MBC6459296.1 HD domain-containing protein [Actinomadura sp. HBU206391]